MHTRNSLESEEYILLTGTGCLNTSFTKVQLNECATAVVGDVTYEDIGGVDCNRFVGYASSSWRSRVGVLVSVD